MIACGVLVVPEQRFGASGPRFIDKHVGGGETGSMYILSYQVRWYIHVTGGRFDEPDH